MELVVAVDLLDGEAVRLRQGRFDAPRRFGDPRRYVEGALDAGARWFHVVDLDRARTPGDRRNADMVGDLIALVREAGGSVEVGGGVRTARDIAELLETGASRVVLGTALVEETLDELDPEHLVAALDYRRGDEGALEVVVSAWERSGGRRLLEASARLFARGVRTQLLTDVGRDGMASGPDLGTYQGLCEVVPVEVIASGGVASADDLAKLAAIRGARGAVCRRRDCAPRWLARVRRGTQRMQSVRVIPCLDVAEGRVVKGVSFVELRDAGDPVELAERYVAEGADELVFLDITASIEERSTLVDLVERVASRVFIPFTVGGGVRVLGDVAALLEAGADKVSMNSAAVADLGLVEAVAGRYGSQCAVVAIDAARTGAGDWEVRTHGGRRPTGLDVETWVRRVSDAGAGELLVTSMDRDGTRAGYDTDLYELVLSCTSLPVIASGGVGIVEHFVDGARTGVTGLLAASVFHYGELSVAQVKAALDAAGLVVRPIGG